MKWVKIDQKTGKPAQRNRNSFMPHDYTAEDFRIINKSFSERKGAWILTRAGNTIGRFDTLKQAKTAAENID